MSNGVSVKLTDKANEILAARMNSYVEALQIVVAAMGLDGDWKYDPTTRSILMVAPDTEAGT